MNEWINQQSISRTAHTPLKIFWSFFTLPPTTNAPHCCNSPLSPPMESGSAVDTGGGWHQWWLGVVIGSSGFQRWWVSGVGWQWCLFVATVVLGCDSRCGHRVLLDSVPGLTQGGPLKGKKVGLKFVFLWILSTSWNIHPPTLMWIN